MATQIGGTIVWNLDVDDSKFKAGLEKAKNSASDLGKTVDKEFSGMESRITRSFDSATQASQLFAKGLLAIGAATVTAAGFGIKYAADVETLTQGFVTLLGSTEKANFAIRQIQKDAATTPFSFKGLTEANLLLTSVTKNAGQSESLLLNIGKALTAAGKSGTELDRVIINLQQIANVGKITELDIRQFGFAGINILELLADYYGTTKEAASDMIKNSKNAFADLEGAFAKAGEGSGRFAKAFQTQAGTMNQLWSNFTDNLGITAGEIVKQTGLFNALKKALSGATDALGYLASQEGLKKIMSFFNFLSQNLPIIIGLIAGGLAPAVRAFAIRSIIPLIASFQALIPFLAIGAAIGLAIKLIIDALGGWDGAVKKFTAGVDWLKGKFAPLVPFFKTKIERIGQIIQGFGISGQFGGLKNAFAGLEEGAKFYTARTLQILGDYYQKAKNFLAFGTTEGQATVADALTGIYNRLKPLIQTLKDIFVPIRKNLELTAQIIDSQLKPAFDNLVTALKPLIDALKPILKSVLIDAFKGLAIAIGTFAAVILGLLTGLVSGIANALPYVVNTITGIVNSIKGFVQIVTGILTGDWHLAWEGAKTVVKGFRDYIVNMFLSIEKFVTGFAKGIWGLIEKPFTEGMNSIKSKIKDWVKDRIQDFVDWKYGAVTAVKSFFTELPATVKAGLMGLVNAMIDYDVKTLTRWGKFWGDMLQTVIDWFTNLPNQFTTGLTNAGTALTTWFTTQATNITTALDTWRVAIETWFTQLPTNITTWLTNAGTAIQNWFINKVTEIQTNLENWRLAIETWFTNLPATFQTGLNNVWVSIQNWFNNLLTNFVEWFTQLGTTAPESIVKGYEARRLTMAGKIVAYLLGFIALVLATLVIGFIDVGIQAVTALSNAIQDTWNKLKNGMLDMVRGWGEAIARAFADGFSKLGDWLKEKITNALNSAKAFIQGKSPPVAGPFKDIDVWGENVGKAWVNGLTSAINGFSLDNPMISPVPAVAPQPAYSGNNRAGIEKLVNIEHMEVREESDITDIARELGFRIELSPGYTQNG